MTSDDSEASSGWQTDSLLPRMTPASSMWIRIVIVFASGGVGLLYGLGTARLPSPAQAHVFWAGNIAASWLLLAFISGACQSSSQTWAAISGVIGDVSAVVGFYWHFLVIDQSSFPQGRGSPFLTRIIGNFPHWLEFIAPWTAFAFATGIACGVLGSWWRTRRSRTAGVILASSFIVEPTVWRFLLGYNQGSWLLPVIETFIGLILLIAAIILSGCRGRSVSREI